MNRNVKSIIFGLIMPLVLVATVSGCATAKVEHHLRNDVDTSKSKVLVFPLFLWDGNKISASKNTNFDNPIVDAAIGKTWSSDLGTQNVSVIPKLVFDKIPGGYEALDGFVKAIDGVSLVEQTTGVTKFIENVTKQFGDHAFAFALVTADEKGYKQSKTVQVNMGLFDTKKLTWKWITKTSKNSSLIPVPYQIVVQDAINANYSYLKKLNGNKVR
jgi:hypothetical protein